MNMSETKKIVALIYRIIIVIIGIYGLYINSAVDGFMYELNYFTIISNLLVVLYFTFAVIRTILKWNEEPEMYLPFKGAVTISILLTFIIFHFVLRPTYFTMGSFSLNSIENIIIHYIIPWMTILDYFMFDKKGEIKKSDPVFWLVIPALYAIYTAVKASFGFTFLDGSAYPYEFMDIDKLGIYKVLINEIIMLITILILSYSCFGIDQLLKKIFNKKKSNK